MFICTPGLAGKTQNVLNSGVSLFTAPDSHTLSDINKTLYVVKWPPGHFIDLGEIIKTTLVTFVMTGHKSLSTVNRTVQLPWHQQKWPSSSLWKWRHQVRTGKQLPREGAVNEWTVLWWIVMWQCHDPEGKLPTPTNQILCHGRDLLEDAYTLQSQEDFFTIAWLPWLHGWGSLSLNSRMSG